MRFYNKLGYVNLYSFGVKLTFAAHVVCCHANQVIMVIRKRSHAGNLHFLVYSSNAKIPTLLKGCAAFIEVM